MRPVNLIPPEERRGDKAPMRTGPLSYVVVAGLALALIAVTAIVLTGNQISDRKAEKESIDSQVAQAEAQASRLKPYADFAALQQARELTVQSLAQSRFNWQRVLREVAIVIPSDVWLTNLAAKVSPDVQTSDSGSSSTSSSSGSSDPSITGPSLDIQGCASGHDAVASFLAALHDVDGVTRVSVLKSDRPDLSASTGSSGTTTAEGCADRDFISTFEIEAAFDAAPAGAAASTTTTSVSAGTAADLSQVQDGQQELQQQKDSAAEKTAKGRKAVDTFIPGTAVAP